MKSRTFGTFALISVSFSASADLLPRLGGKVVYDPDQHITWLADANLAASNSFGLPSCDEVGGYPACVYPGGGIEHAYIDAPAFPNGWLFGMNTDGGTGYLGFNAWRLPKTLIPDPSCEFPYSNEFHGANCTGSEMGHLFYEELGGLPKSRSRTAATRISRCFRTFRLISIGQMTSQQM